MISGRTAATRSGPLWKSQDLGTDDCPLPGKDAETFGSLCDRRRHRPQMTGRVLPVRDPQDSTRSSQSRFAKSGSTPSLYRAGRTWSSDRFATRHERRRIPPKEAAASRLGVRRFCRDQGLAVSTFSLWRKKLSSPVKEIKQPLAVHRQALSERVGIIVRLNAKTAPIAVNETDGHWRVSYALLRKIVDI